MPIFEYRCMECQQEFEHLLIHSSSSAVCPTCNGNDLEKMISFTAMSSDSTRRRTLQKAKKRVDKVRYEKEYEEHKKRHQHSH